MKSGIYRLIARRPGKPKLFYIGQAVNFDRRERDHFRHLRGGRHDNWRLQALFDKYGEEIFSFEKALVCATGDLTHYEQAILDFYVGTVGRAVLNICRECVASTAGVSPSAETRALMSAAKKGKPGRIWSLESKTKMSATNKGKLPSPQTVAAGIAARTGTTASQETRAKMSASQSGRVDPLETKEKKKIAAVKRSESPEYRAALSSALLGNQNMLGKTHSAETRAKLSIAAVKREAAKREKRQEPSAVR